MSQEPDFPEGFDWRAFTPDDSPLTPMDVLADPLTKDLATAKLGPGDTACDFELPVYDFRTGVKRETGETFHLLPEAERRPVALIFGSYT